MIRTSTTIEAQSEHFMKHLLSRLFVRNGYGTAQALIAAIDQASSIPADTEWHKRKDAFNRIAETAPMRDDGFLLRIEEVPTFLAVETAAFRESLLTDVADLSSSMRIEMIFLSADQQIGLSTVSCVDDEIVDSCCDWGNDYPNTEMESGVFLLYGHGDRLLDRAVLDGDVWREIEQAGTEDFYRKAFDAGSINQALQDFIHQAHDVRKL